MALKVNRFGSPVAYDTVTIAAAASLSGEFNTNGFVMCGITVPADWDTANLTFQGSNVSGGTYSNVYDDVGSEYTVAAAASRHILLNPAAFSSFQFIKIRSGTSGTPVAQTLATELIVHLRQMEGYER